MNNMTNIGTGMTAISTDNIADNIGLESVADHFLDALNLHELREALDAVAERLGIDDSPTLHRHALMQYRIYGTDVLPDAAYFSALSSGYFRTNFSPIPLRQIGVKILLDQLAGAPFSEVYVDPVNRQDFASNFDNCDRVDFSLDLIGFGVALSNMREVIETYYWEEPGETVDESIEIRLNMMTGEKTPYYRHDMTGGTISIPEEFTPDEADAIRAMLGNASGAAGDGLIDPVFIYSRKIDREKRPYISFYLTSNLL